MTDRRLRAVYAVPIAGGAVGAIVAAGIAAGVAISGGIGSADEAAAPTTTTIEATATTEARAGGSGEEVSATTEVDRPAPLDVLVRWDGAAIAFVGVAQSVEQVDSLGPDAPGSVDVAGPGAVTADAEVAAFGTFVASLPAAFTEAEARLTVDSVMLTGVLAPGFTEDDVVSELADAGLGALTQQVDVTSAPGT